MIVEPVTIPELSETVSSFEEAKNIILGHLSIKKTELPPGSDSDLYKVLTKYYSKIINDKILKESPYPIDCKLIRDLFFKFDAKNINEFGDKLKAIEKAHGKVLLCNIFEEARGQKGIELTQKLSSLQAEIYCAYLLASLGTLKKLIDGNGCDFIFQYNGEKWCIQVKRKNNEFHNLCLIADAVSSELYIRDNNILREFTRVRFDGEAITYHLRRDIVKFIHSDLFANTFNECVKFSEGSFKFYEIEYLFNDISIKVIGNEQKTEFIFKHEDKQTNIEFKKNGSRFQHYDLKNSVYYPDEENLQIDKLSNRLSKIIEEAKDNFPQCSNVKKALFIQLDISPQNENNFKNRIDVMKNLIEEKISNFPTLIFPSSCFEKFKPILNQAAENSIFKQFY